MNQRAANLLSRAPSVHPLCSSPCYPHSSVDLHALDADMCLWLPAPRPVRIHLHTAFISRSCEKGEVKETVAPRGGRQSNMPGATVKKEASSNAPSLRSSSSRGGGASGAGAKEETKKPTIPGFLTKTFEIFSNDEFEDLCGWGENGDTIIIKKVPEFSSTVLPRYFKHSNFQSFVRQLNMYDFHKTVQDPSHGEFRHEFFRRGREDLLHKIKRKVSQPSSSSSSHHYSSRSSNSGGSSHVNSANSETYNAAAAMMTLPTQGVATAPVCGLSMLAESSTLKSARSPASGGAGSSGSASSRKHPRDPEEDTERRVVQLEDMVKALHETNQSLWAQVSATRGKQTLSNGRNKILIGPSDYASRKISSVCAHL